MKWYWIYAAVVIALTTMVNLGASGSGSSYRSSSGWGSGGSYGGGGGHK
jgi:uncharacterized membrane protein YgcG